MQIYAIPQLGQVPAKRDKRKIFGFVDSWIESLRNLNKREFTQEEAIGLASTAVKMAAERNEHKSAYLLGCDLKGQALAVCEQIRDHLGKDNIQVVINNGEIFIAYRTYVWYNGIIKKQSEVERQTGKN